jgi:hypothetical protein
MPSSATNHSINTTDRKRRCVSLTNSKKIRRSELINHSQTERLSRSSSISDSFNKIHHMTDINFNSRFSTLRQINETDCGKYKREEKNG